MTVSSEARLCVGKFVWMKEREIVFVCMRVRVCACETTQTLALVAKAVPKALSEAVGVNPRQPSIEELALKCDDNSMAGGTSTKNTIKTALDNRRGSETTSSLFIWLIFQSSEQNDNSTTSNSYYKKERENTLGFTQI